MKRILYFILILFLLSVSNVNASLTDGLVAYWDFNETSGTIAYDSVASYNMVATNSIVLTDACSGILGTGACFSGNNYYMTNTNLSNSGDFSYSIWAYPTSYTDTHVFNPRAGTFNNRGSLVWYPNITGYTGFGGMIQSFNWGSPSAQTINNWHHLALVREGNNIRFYVNDVNIFNGTTTQVGTFDNILFGTGTTSSGFFAGNLDEFAFYNRSLNRTEISSLYNSGDGLAYPFSVGVDPVNITSVSIDTNSTSVLVNEPFSFNISFLPVDADNVSFIINFSDGATSTSFTGTKSYSVSGVYNMSVLATDNQSNNVYDFVMINVTDSSVPEPEPVNLTNVSFTAINSLNQSIVGFSVSINDDDYFGSTSTDTLVLELPEDTINNTLYKLVYSKFGYYTSSYDDVNLSSLSHEGTLVERSYVGDESLDDKAIIWILLAITGGIGASAIFARPMLVVFGFWLLFMTYFLSNNIMVAYYWFAPLGYVLGAIVILTGMLRLGFGEKF